MKIKRTYRFYPTPRQQRALAQTFGCVRVVYNAALALRQSEYTKGNKLTYGALSKALTERKQLPNFAFLQDVSSVPLQQSLRHLDTAYVNFFAKRAKFPRFKSKRDHHQSAHDTLAGFRFESGFLSVAKIGRLSVVWSKVPESAPRSISITKDASDRYWVTLTLDTEMTHLPQTGTSVGLDLGIASLVTLSTGEKVANPRHIKVAAVKLAKAQRILMRRQRGSQRYRRQRLRVAKLHAHVAACRKDTLNKVTTSLVRRFDVIAVEDLHVKGMVRNHCLAQAISDVGFGEFRRQLAYKCGWYGREFKVVDRFTPTSKVCSACTAPHGAMDLSVREWTCAACGAHHDRDVNAAKNILAVGKTVIARGEYVSPKTVKTVQGRARRSVNLPALGVA